MNRNFANPFGKQSIAGSVVPICKHLVMIGLVALAASVPGFAQSNEHNLAAEE